MKFGQYLATIMVLVLLFASCSKETVTDTDIVVAVNAVAVEQELMEMVNTHRNAIGASSLEFSAEAYEYANLHTDYMIAKGSISHDNFSSRASSLAAKTNAKQIAENVAKDYPTAEAVFQGWLASSDHKGTMEADFTHSAVSVKKDSDGRYFYTQLFFK